MTETKSSWRSLDFHNRFWLQILGDHCRFMEAKLEASQKEFLAEVKECKALADDALVAVGSSASKSAAPQEVLDRVMRLKKALLAGLVEGTVKANMTPTFVNHMINEGELYQKILTAANGTGTVPPFDVLSHHKLWLLDAEGHAYAIATELDAVEKKLHDECMEVMKDFKLLCAKTEEFIGYLRSGTQNFPALSKLSKDSDMKMRIFVDILKEIQELKDSKAVMTMSSPLEIDHMLREEAYYLEGLADAVGVGTVRVYDPIKPRKEA